VDTVPGQVDTVPGQVDMGLGRVDTGLGRVDTGPGLVDTALGLVVMAPGQDMMVPGLVHSPTRALQDFRPAGLRAKSLYPGPAIGSTSTGDPYINKLIGRQV